MPLKKPFIRFWRFLERENLDSLFWVIVGLIGVGTITISWFEPNVKFYDGLWWSVVTLTTVGYGDISPQTALGQTIASIIMIIGYGIIAVPTGIVTAELSQTYRKEISTQACPECSAEGHDKDAKFCKFCGSHL